MKGKIKSGLGQGSYWITKFTPVFMREYSIKLFPGTLNVEIEEDYKLVDSYKVIPGFEYGGTDRVLVQKCIILGETAYIVRPERNNKENGDHPLNILEIISDVNFREKFNLKNDDEIEITLI